MPRVPTAARRRRPAGQGAPCLPSGRRWTAHVRGTPSEPDADLAVPDSWSTAMLHDWTGRRATTSAVPRQGSVGTPRVRPAGFSLTRAAKRPAGQDGRDGQHPPPLVVLRGVRPRPADAPGGPSPGCGAPTPAASASGGRRSLQLLHPHRRPRPRPSRRRRGSTPPGHRSWPRRGRGGTSWWRPGGRRAEPLNLQRRQWRTGSLATRFGQVQVQTRRALVVIPPPRVEWRTKIKSRVPRELRALNAAGMAEHHRVLRPGGRRGTDAPRWTPPGQGGGLHQLQDLPERHGWVMQDAEALGLELTDRFEYITKPRPQPGGRRQVHGHRNSYRNEPAIRPLNWQCSRSHMLGRGF